MSYSWHIIRVWVSYPLKQGLKLPRKWAGCCCGQDVWVSYPLKQGLKLLAISVFCFGTFCLSQLSIKTRIETAMAALVQIVCSYVWVSYPLKQGLKLRPSVFLTEFLKVWVSYPLKQGLKPSQARNVVDASSLVWVSYPLKQGLKPRSCTWSWKCRMSLSQLSIKTRIETLLIASEASHFSRLSQLSIKTRIETTYMAIRTGLLPRLSQLSIKTRIETN